MTKRALAALALSVILSTSTRARAEDAAQLKARGDAAMVDGRAADALAAYVAAQAIEPSPALDFNEGRARYALGDVVGALEAFERFEANAPQDLRAKAFRVPEILAELRGRVTTLALECRTPGAVVEVGGARHALPLAAPLRVASGRVRLRVEAPHHAPYEQTLDLVGGGTSTLVIALERARAEAFATVSSAAAGASARVDDGPAERLPLRRALAPGRHAIRVSAPDHAARVVVVELREGERRTVDVPLERAKGSWLASPWPWLGGAVIVGAAVATVVVVSSSSEPRGGSLGTFDVP